MSEAIKGITDEMVDIAAKAICRAKVGTPPQYEIKHYHPDYAKWARAALEAVADRLPLATPEAGLEMARAAFAEAALWSDQAPLVEERARMYRADGTWSEEEYLEWKRAHDAWSRDVAAQFEDFVKRFQLNAARAARPEGGA